MDVMFDRIYIDDIDPSSSDVTALRYTIVNFTPCRGLVCLYLGYTGRVPNDAAADSFTVS
jgi:hypothetical protein